MSNIPDITTLSDLLNTSPSQPTIDNERNRIPDNLLGPAEKEQHEQIHRYTQDDQQQIDNGRTEEKSGESEMLRKLVRSGLPEDKIEGLEKLLAQQSEKLNLSNERNELLKKRTSLKTSVDELRVKIKHLQTLNKKLKQKDKLNKLLEHNDKTFLESQKPKTTKRPEEQDDNDYILKHLHVLPSNNFKERLMLVKKFYPYLEIDKAKCVTSYDEKKGSFNRTISYNVRSPLLFILPVTITINSSDESIIFINIPKANDNDGIITNFLLLSSSFTRVFIQNYILYKKIDLVMHSLNSLSIAIHKRIMTFYKLIRKFRQYVSSGSYIDELVKDDETNRETIFTILKSVDNIRFSIPVEGDVNYLFSMTLHWEIIIPNSITGDCISDAKIFLAKGNKKHDAGNNADIIEGANSLFLRLSKEYGIFNAVCILFKNVFGKINDET